MNVNVWDQGDAMVALIRSSDRVDLARLAGPGVALKDLIGTSQTEGEAR